MHFIKRTLKKANKVAVPLLSGIAPYTAGLVR